MEESITPFRIANAILQDKDFSGKYVLVEGKKDVKVYRKFFSNKLVKFRPTFGKYKLRETYGILTERGFVEKIGIRDSDFLRIKDNIKYDENFNDNIFATDHHDSEIMMIESRAFDNFLSVVCDEEKIAAFEYSKKLSVKDIIYSLTKNLACLRLANKRFGLGLSFKPELPDGNRLKFSKFICDKKCDYLGDDALINIVVEYSKNRGNIVADRDLIKEKLKIIRNENYDLDQIVNGHDACEVISVISKNGLKSSNKIFRDCDSIEDALALAFDREQFSKTSLCKKIIDWESSVEAKILVSE